MSVFWLAANIRGPRWNRTSCQYPSHVTVTSCLCVTQQLKVCQYHILSHLHKQRQDHYFPGLNSKHYKRILWKEHFHTCKITTIIILNLKYTFWYHFLFIYIYILFVCLVGVFCKSISELHQIVLFGKHQPKQICFKQILKQNHDFSSAWPAG